MKRILQTLFLLALSIGVAKSQVYLTENFEGAFTGNPAAPAGWTQTRIILQGDGTPEPLNTSGEKDWMQNTVLSPATWLYQDGATPVAAFSGSSALWIEDNSFSSSSAAGSRRMESPSVNLASSTSPYVRFMMYYGNGSQDLNLRVVASNDGGITWTPLMFIMPNADVTTFAATTPWQRINVRIPNAYKVANAKFALEVSGSWSSNNIFIDNFSVEEFTPTTITSAASGLWNSPATWVGGIVPTCDNNVVIASSHTVSMNVLAARVQNMTVDGMFQYNSTLTTENLQIFGDLTVNSTGNFFSGNGTSGKKTHLGGSIVCTGTLNFSPGTSTSGQLIWLGGTASSTYSNSGVLVNNRIPIVWHANPLGVSYLTPIFISNQCALNLGQVNGNNIALGNPPASAVFTMIRSFGAFSSAPLFSPTNISSRSNTYQHDNSTIGFTYFMPAQNIVPGEEVELVGSDRLVRGTLTMNTYNNLQLNYPLTVGTATAGVLSLSRGIIITTSTNILTLNQTPTGALGITPTTFTCNGTNTGNHGSYIAGPVRTIFNTSTTNRNIPLGEGVAFHNNLPSSNVLRLVTFNANAIAWNTQTITTQIVGAPSGAVNPTLSTVFGTRAYQISYAPSSATLNPGHTISFRFNNSSFGGSDLLAGNLQDVRIAQAPTLNGPWTEKSLTTGTGPIANDVLQTRTTGTAATNPTPLTNDEFFAWASTGLAIDNSITALLSPTTVGCYGPNQTVAVRVLNSGVANLNFATNPATVNCVVSGATNATLTPFVLNSGTLAANAAQTVVLTTTLNMTAPGAYLFDATITTTGDANLLNDAMLTATRTVVSPTTIPLVVDFTGFNSTNLPTVFPGWYEATGAIPTGTTGNWNFQTGVGSPTNITARINLYTTSANAWIIGPKFTASPTTYLTFDAAVTAWTSTNTPIAMGSDDMVRVMVSTDCGSSFTPIYTVSAANNLGINFTNFGVSLAPYAGQDIIVGFYATDGPIDNTEDLDFHLDNINIYNLPGLDASVNALTSPTTTGCYTNNQSVNVTLKNMGANTISNVPVTVIVSGPINQTLTTTFTPSIASMGTVNVSMGLINMTAAGTYSFNSFSGLVGDAIPANDANFTTRVVAPTFTLPIMNNFTGFTGGNLPTVQQGWVEGQGLTAPGTATTSNWISFNGFGFPSNVNARVQLFGNTYREWIISPKFVPTTSTQVTFDAAVTDLAAVPGPSVMGSDDMFRVFVSTDCGVSYTPIFTINATNSLTPSFTNFSVALGAYAGQPIILGFQATDGAIDNVESYYFHLENVNIYNQSSADAGITAITNPTSTTCYGPNENVTVTLKNQGTAAIANIPVTVIISGAVNSTLSTTFVGPLAPSATAAVNVGTLNMVNGGTFNFKAFSSLVGDGFFGNDTSYTTRTTPILVATPNQVSFTGYTGANLPAFFAGWNEGQGVTTPTNTTSNWISFTGLSTPTNVTARVQLFGNTRNEWIYGPKITMNTNSQLTFDAAVTDLAASNPSTSVMGSDDKVRVMVSTDCGVSYTPIFTLNASNALSNTLTTFTVPLNAYAGQDVMIAFLAQDGPVDDIESYYFHLDNINIVTPWGNDVGAISMTTPSAPACYSASEPVNVVITNYGMNTQTNVPVEVVISGVINTTLTGSYTGTLAPSASATVNMGLINMSAAGVYSFNVKTSLLGDNQIMNDAISVITRTVVAPLPLPFFDNFNAVVGNIVPAGYTADNNTTWDFLVTNNGGAEHGTGNPATRGFASNLWSGNNTTWLNLPKVGPLTSTSTFAFDYRIVDFSPYANPGGNATTLGQDTIFIKMSIDCGATYSVLGTITSTNHVTTNTFVTKTYTVGAFAGNDAIFRFEGKWATGDYWFDLDNINICAGPPSAPVANTPSICAGNSVVLTATTSGQGQWYASSTPTSYIATGTTYTTPILNANTTYYVLDSTSCGLSTLTAINITVAPTPTLSANSSNSVVCAGSNVTLTASGMNTYTWSTSATNAVIVQQPSVTTTYTVTGFSNLCNITQTSSVMVSVNALPSVSLTAGATTICAGAGSIALTGSPAGGAYSGAAVSGSLLSIANSGTFTPMYTFTNSSTGCSNSATTTVIIANCTGINESIETSGLVVYPNPNNGSFVVETDNFETKNIEILDVTGRVVYSERSSNNKILININELANGMYQVRISSSAGTDVIKVIKQ